MPTSSWRASHTPDEYAGQAVALLGIQTVKGLVLGFSLECAVRGNDSDEVSFDFAGYWRRSLQVATAARMIARHVQARDPETAFISGLVQDAGGGRSERSCDVGVQDANKPLHN